MRTWVARVKDDTYGVFEAMVMQCLFCGAGQTRRVRKRLFNQANAEIR